MRELLWKFTVHGDGFRYTRTITTSIDMTTWSHEYLDDFDQLVEIVPENPPPWYEPVPSVHTRIEVT